LQIDRAGGDHSRRQGDLGVDLTSFVLEEIVNLLVFGA
jgi:hypothetical protein